MCTHFNNFVLLFAFEVVFFAVDSLQPSSYVVTVVSVVFELVLCCTCWRFVPLKLWSLVMCPRHAMSLRHDGLDLDMSQASCFGSSSLGVWPQSGVSFMGLTCYYGFFP